MHFVQRLRTVWSWLPSFRAVAETEHLPTAAQELGIVSSSLSRTVKQLEDELGVALFDRTTKTLVLNDAGRTVLVAVREAMRVVDEALAAAIGDDLRGPVAAVATSDLAHAILVPAAAALTEAHPSLVLSALIASPDDTADMLLRGDADVAILLQPPPVHSDLRATELASWTRAVFTRPGHVAATEDRCVVVGTSAEHVDDGWPSGTARTVAAWAPDERAALELCALGDLVTVAFDAVVRHCGLHDRLVRRPTPEILPRTLYLVHRRPVGRHRRTEALVEAIRVSCHGT